MDVIQPLIHPDWPAPARVQAMVTTRAFGDVSQAGTKEKLRRLLPGEPAWLRQVHGTRVVAVDSAIAESPQADASVTQGTGIVCAVMAADCMPVLLADERGSVVAAAHAGWRGMAAGVIEAAVGQMRVPSGEIFAWLGPAIGPTAYEIGEEVRDAFLSRDPDAERAFVATRPGHWLLDLYAVARQRLAAQGVARVHGGGYCTLSEKDRFFSFRRDRTAERMAALIWLT